MWLTGYSRCCRRAWRVASAGHRSPGSRRPGPCRPGPLAGQVATVSDVQRELNAPPLLGSVATTARCGLNPLVLRFVAHPSSCSDQVRTSSPKVIDRRSLGSPKFGVPTPIAPSRRMTRAVSRSLRHRLAYRALPGDFRCHPQQPDPAPVLCTTSRERQTRRGGAHRVHPRTAHYS